MAYTPIFADPFERANTIVGTAPNSTNFGNGWIDFQGNLWIVNGGLMTHPNDVVPNGNVTLNALYRPESEWVVNGKVHFTQGNQNSCAAVARFRPENGGSGYSALIYGNSQIFFYKAVNGAHWNLQGGIGFNSTGLHELIVQQINETTTQLTVNSLDPDTLEVVDSHSITDATPELQNLSGSFGLSGFSNTSCASFASFAASIELTAGVTNKIKAFKSVVKLSDTAVTGGVGAVTYQRFRSTVAGQLGAPISGATTLLYRDFGLTPGTTYYYTTVATDSAANSVTYPQLSVSTLPSSGFVKLKVGDSITAGAGSTSKNAVDTEVEALNAMGIYCESINTGVYGAQTSDWQEGGSIFEAAIAASDEAGGAICADIMLGTNDAINGSVPAATYRTRLEALIASLFDRIETLEFVTLNYPPFAQTTTEKLALLVAYQAEIDALVNGTTIRQGDKTAFSYIQAHQNLLGDYAHPNQPGHTWLGNAWAVAFARAVDYVAPSSPLLSAVAGNTQIALSAVAPADSDTAKIRFYRGTTVISEQNAAPGATVNFTDTGRVNGTSYTYTATALDAAGNESATSNAVTIAPVAPVQGDTTRPTTGAATLTPTGLTLMLSFSEAVIGSTGLVVKVAGLSRAFSISGSGASRMLTLSSAVYTGQAVTLDYSPGNIADAAGNALLAFTGLAVTNGSTVAAPVVAPSASPFTLKPVSELEADPTVTGATQILTYEAGGQPKLVPLSVIRDYLNSA